LVLHDLGVELGNSGIDCESAVVERGAKIRTASALCCGLIAELACADHLERARQDELEQRRAEVLAVEGFAQPSGDARRQQSEVRVREASELHGMIHRRSPKEIEHALAATDRLIVDGGRRKASAGRLSLGLDLELRRHRVTSRRLWKLGVSLSV